MNTRTGKKTRETVPCPRCGSTNIRHTRKAVYDLGYTFEIQCMACRYSVSDDDIDKAFEKWQNKNPDS